MIQGDVAVVHHDCLRRWLVESADNVESLVCKVCNQSYEVERGSQFSLAQVRAERLGGLILEQGSV